MLQVSVYRYNPEKDAAPFMQDFQIDTGGKDIRVLDVLALIKEQDEVFSYRRSCREGVCGSDGMNINGKNGLACITPLSAAGLKDVYKRQAYSSRVVRCLAICWYISGWVPFGSSASL